MSLWLIVLAALLLIPVVRLFMATGCASSAPPPPPGTDPISINTVVGASSFPGNPGEATIDHVSLNITAPSGETIPTISTDGPLEGYTLAVTPAMFSEGRTFWSALCTIAYTPTNLPGPSGSQAGSASWAFDANHNGTLTFTLSLGVNQVNPDPQGGQPPIDLPEWFVTGHGS